MTDYIWTSLKLPTPGPGGTPAPNPATMILLTDGTVLVQSYFSTDWFIFSPEPGTGLYGDYNPDPAKINWTQVGNSQKAREYYASGVLKDGRVFIHGGEYSNPSQPNTVTDDTSGEIYDPVTKNWSPMTSAFNWISGDSSCAVLPDGRVIFGGSGGGSQTAIWDPTAPVAEAWVVAGTAFGTQSNSKVGICDEETWTLLQDGSVLTVNIQTSTTKTATGSERYVPALDLWVSAGTPINSLPYWKSGEMGPGLSLPDGRAFFVGANGNTGIFDSTNTGTPWTAGPSMEPSDAGNPYNATKMAADAPAALLPNGLVLVCGGEPVLINNTVFSGSPIFFLYNPKNNSLTSMQANGGQDVTTQAIATYQCCLLLLPSGQVLLSTTNNELFSLTLDASVNTPDKSWMPIIDSAPSVMLPGQTYTIQGRQLMGLSEGCNYGDDLRNATNYPIVRITQPPDTVYYCRTYDFSSMGISPTETQLFTVEIPQNLPPGVAGPPNQGTYMEVITNGIPSDPFPVTISLYDSQMLTELDLIGQGVVNAAIQSTGSAIVTNVLKVWVDGFKPSQLGLSSSADLINPPSGLKYPTISLSPEINVEFNGYAPILAEDESLPDSPQRFAFQFQADFIDLPTSNTTFSSLGGDLLNVQLNSQFVSTDNITVITEGFISLTTNPTPYFKHADPTVGNGAEWYLSTDLRAFQITANIPRYYNMAPQLGDPQTVATEYISNLLETFNNPPPGFPQTPDQVFESLPLTEDDPNSVTLFTTDNNGTPVYNFCIARVNFANTASPAPDVRVFFRLFPGAQGYATYDTNALYRNGPTSDGGIIPLVGTITPGSDNIGTIPFFAKPRVDSLTTSTAKQQDDTPNVMTLGTTAPGQTKSFFFGVWLDINQPKPPVYPVELLGAIPGNLPDGPYIGVQNVEPILELIRSTHQCLIAEINFSDDPITPGSNPSNCQQLAQRNLVWQSVANPGLQGSRQASVPFEIRPTPSVLAVQRTFDELVFQWDQVPLGSLLSVYLPVVQATDIVNLANVMYYSNTIQVVDPNTIAVVVTGTVTYIPIPTQTSNDPFVGLLSLGCPLGIVKGQVFNVTVKQVTTNAKQVQPPPQGPPPPQIPKPPPVPQKVQAKSALARVVRAAQVGTNVNVIAWRRVLGQFRLAIPVSTKADMLDSEERTLSLLRFIELSIPVSDRWYLVFKRYVDNIAGRVSDLGGDPTTIFPDPNGGVKTREPCHRRHDVCVGRVCKLFYDCCGVFNGFEIEMKEKKRVETKDFRDVERELEKLIERLFEKTWMLEVVSFKGKVCELKIRGRDDRCE